MRQKEFQKHSSNSMAYNRMYTDADREQNQMKIKQFQQMQRQALDEQRAENRPASEKFRDGQMSQKEYDRYEQGQLKRFKETLLQRIASKAKWLSAFDMAQAEEFAQTDEEFRRLLEQAKNHANSQDTKQTPSKTDVIPPKLSKLEELRLKQAQARQLNNEPLQFSLPQSPQQASVQQSYQPSPVQQRSVEQNNIVQYQPTVNDNLSQQMILSTQQMMQQMMQQQAMYAQMQNPQQWIQMINQYQEQRINAQKEQQYYIIESLKNQIQSLEDKLANNQIPNQNYQKDIQKYEQERAQLQNQIVELQRVKQLQEEAQTEQAKDMGPNVKDAQTYKGVTLGELQKKNNQRWKMLLSVQDRFNLQ